MMYIYRCQRRLNIIFLFPYKCVRAAWRGVKVLPLEARLEVLVLQLTIHNSRTFNAHPRFDALCVTELVW